MRTIFSWTIGLMVITWCVQGHTATAGGSASRSAAWRPGALIVKFHPSSDPKHFSALAGNELAAANLPAVLRELGRTNAISRLRPVAHPDWAARLPATSALHGVYEFQMERADSDIPALCRSLARDPAVEYAHPNYFLQLDFVADDPFFSSAGTWGQPYDDQWGLKLAQVPPAWDLTVGSNDVVVAVLDSGIDATHPDLQGRIAPNGWNFVDSSTDTTDITGHGTFCAGIIAATVNNGIGIAGVCPNAKILPLKIVDATGRISTYDAASAIDYAMNQGVRLMNLSFSGEGSPTLQQAIFAANANNAVLIASAGNKATAELKYPAAYCYVIAVGASDSQDRLADFSNFGPGIDVVAPGGDSGSPSNGYSIVSLRAANTSVGTPLDSLYSRWRGTSFSAPFVSGVVALMRAHQPRLQNERIRQILRTTADDVGAPGWDWQTGYGRVNAWAALQPTNANLTLLTSPTNFTFLSGTVEVAGTAYGVPFAWWVVEWGYGWQPTNWTLLASNNVRTFRSYLASWDSTPFPDGEYAFRLRSCDPEGHLYEDRVVISTYNRLHNFDPPTHPGWPQDTYANATSPVLADLNGDGKAELLWGERHAMVVKKPDGRAYPGWPRPIPGSPRGSASVADLDGDGLPEIGIISNDDTWDGTNDTLHLWRMDGTPLPGWPRQFDPDDSWSLSYFSPVFADIDGDGTNDIIWCSSIPNATPWSDTTVIHVEHVNGTPVAGWPVKLPEASFGSSFSPAIGDADGDGKLDLAMLTGAGEIFLLHHNGVAFAGWPIQLAQYNYGGVPALADIDHDGELEVFAEASEGWTGCYKVNGSPLPGWPIYRPVGAYTPPAFGDLDEDGKPEILVDTVLRSDGTTMPGWPPQYIDRLHQPIVADLDGDGHLDVASPAGRWDTHGWDEYFHAWNSKGEELYHMGFPIKPTGQWCSSGAVAGDLQGNGSLNLAMLISDNETGSVYDVWDLPVPFDSSRAPYPTLLGDNAHHSRYHVPPALFTVTPGSAVTNGTSQHQITGDHFLKGMRVFVNNIPQPVISETVTSIVFTLTGTLPPGRYDLTVSNLNSSATTKLKALSIVSSRENDDDGDGLPNGWEMDHALDPLDDGSLNPSNGALGDPDSDGAFNSAEYQAGTDPHNVSSVFKILGAKLTASGEVSLAWSSVAGKTYAVYGSSAAGGSFVRLTNGLTATPPENRFLDTNNLSAGPWFYQIRLE